MAEYRGPLRYARVGDAGAEQPRLAPADFPCTHETSLCCGKCAAWWSRHLVSRLPARTGRIVIQDDYHAHTAAMRLHNVADKLAKDPSLLGELADPEVHERVLRGLRETAEQISAKGEPE